MHLGLFECYNTFPTEGTDVKICLTRLRPSLLSLHRCVSDISNSLMLTHLPTGTARRQAPRAEEAGAATRLYFRPNFHDFSHRGHTDAR